MHYRDIFEDFLKNDDAYKCALWAFGEGFETIDEMHLCARWHKIHGDLFELKESDGRHPTIVKIIKEWLFIKYRETHELPKTIC